MRKHMKHFCFRKASNSNELTHLAGLLKDDFHSFPRGTAVTLVVLPSGKLAVVNREVDGEFYWTSPVKDVTLTKWGVEVRTRNSVIRVETEEFLESLNFSRILLSNILEDRRQQTA